MADEWTQHNLAYELLPGDSHWRENVMNVDLDPDDQGFTLEDFYESRTGERLNLQEIYNKLIGSGSSGG